MLEYQLHTLHIYNIYNKVRVYKENKCKIYT